MTDSTDASTDLLHRFIFDNTDIRGEVVSLQQTIADVFEHHNYPAPIRTLVGEFATAAALLSRTLNFDGVLTLQARGDGDLSIVMAEVNHQKKVRAVAQYAEGATFDGEHTLSALTGKGVLSIIIDPDKGQRYQGIVPLDNANLAQCLESYFDQSEQLPTKLWLSCDGQRATGMLLQRLPQQIADKETNDDVWETQSHLASTVTTEELIDLDHETLLTRLFHETGVRVFEPEMVAFGCSCSKSRSSKALQQLEQQELKAIVAEEGKITVDCHFCGFQYTYDDADVDALFAPETKH